MLIISNYVIGIPGNAFTWSDIDINEWFRAYRTARGE
jgi:hypothetical protein